MTEAQKKKIRKLRVYGHSYKEIAQLTELSEGTVKSFVSRSKTKLEEPSNTCKCCGKPIISIPHHKERKFCSRECGLLWWHSHSELLYKKANYTFTCPACNTTFTVYGQSQRKYCSHSCYVKARFGGIQYAI